MFAHPLLCPFLFPIKAHWLRRMDWRWVSTCKGFVDGHVTNSQGLNGPKKEFLHCLISRIGYVRSLAISPVMLAMELEK